MAILLFSLRGVPDDESFEIKDLLLHHQINFYETSAGNWGISMPALWLKDETQLKEAQHLLSEYHIQRATIQKEIYQEQKNKGSIDAFKRNPVKYIIYLAGIAFMLYLYPKMLFEFGL